MKTSQLWVNVSTTDHKRTWRWKPHFTKTHIVYEQGERAFLSPMWEMVWGCFVFQYTAWHCKTLYKTGIDNPHECPADIKQERINELEAAIRTHKQFWSGEKMVKNDVDNALWAVLRDNNEQVHSETFG